MNAEPVHGFLVKMLDSTEFWSTIVGAAVGGAIALATQLLALREARKHRTADRLRSDRALGHSLLFKMIRIHADFFNLFDHCNQCISKAGSDAETMELAQMLEPVANPPERISFSAEEMGMLLGLGDDDDVFNQVQTIEAAHQSLVASFALYVSKRAELSASLKSQSADGRKVIATVSDQAVPLMVEVHSLADSLAMVIVEFEPKAGEVLSGLHSVLREKLGFSHHLVSRRRASRQTEADGTGTKDRRQ